MFRVFRDLSSAIQSLTKALVDGDEVGPRAAALGERLDGLELGRAKWEAEMEALYMRAEGKLKASRNAEERARKMRSFDEDFLDLDDEDSPAPEEERPQSILPLADVQTGEEAGVYGLPVGMEADGKSLALRAKFGG